MNRLSNFLFGPVSYILVAYLIYIMYEPRFPEFNAMGMGLEVYKYPLVGVVAISFICLFFGSLFEFSPKNKAPQLILSNVIFFLINWGTGSYWLSRVGGTEFHPGDLLIILLAIVNLMISTSPALILFEDAIFNTKPVKNNTDDDTSDYSYEVPKRQTTKTVTSVRGVTTEITTKHYSNGRSEVNKRRLS